jgi:hypothetical protein
MPPENEQDTIISFVHTATAQFVKAISRAQREIELISEFRTRLIVDVVTGKVDVRRLAPTEGESMAIQPDELQEGIDPEILEELDEGESALEAANADD